VRHTERDASEYNVPYKLFEVVEGAVLEVVARSPDARVEANLVVTTAVGREFVYTARASAGADGIARLRLPYSNESSGDDAQARASKHRTRTGPAWTIEMGGVPSGRIVVPESAVLEGRTLRFAPE
jgi:hypothetical protein